MLQTYLNSNLAPLCAFLGILFAFMATIIATAKLSDYLPKDAGRDFAPRSEFGGYRH